MLSTLVDKLTHPTGRTAARPPQPLRARTLGVLEPFRDPLGRKVGESLDRARFTEAQLAQRKLSRGPRAWAAVEMQDPRIVGSNLIDRNEHFLSRDPNKRRVLSPAAFREATRGLTWGRGWDFAFSSKEFNRPDPDWSVGVKMAWNVDEDAETLDIYIDDIVRFRELWGASKRRIRDTAKDDGAECPIGGEGNGAQSAALQDIQGMPALANYLIVPIPLSADKSVRAQGWASRAQSRQIWLKEAAWNNIFFDEAEAFPNGGHDDIVDGISVVYHLCAMIYDGLDATGHTDPPDLSELPFTSRW